ncbi:hypothetical protein [Kosakonia oryziphila]
MIKKQPLHSFRRVVVYSAALTVSVAQRRGSITRKIN